MKSKPKPEPVIYTYAGFKYRVVGTGPYLIMVAVAGQHPAASRLKNMTNARQSYLEDQAKKRSA